MQNLSLQAEDLKLLGILDGSILNISIAIRAPMGGHTHALYISTICETGSF